MGLKVIKEKYLIWLWIIDVIWTILGHLTLVVFPEGNILLKDIIMAVGYSTFRIFLFTYSVLYIIVHLFKKNVEVRKKVQGVVLPIMCYVGDAIVLTILYKLFHLWL